MKATRKFAAGAAAAVLGITLLAACGSSAEETASSPAASETSESPSPVASPTESTPLVGGDPSTWSPVEITVADNDSRIRLVEGQFAVFTDLPVGEGQKIYIVPSKDGIVDATNPTKSTNGGLQAIAVGKTSVTVYQGKPNGKNSTVVMKIRVTVAEYVPEATQ
jgi:hypothetical protein